MSTGTGLDPEKRERIIRAVERLCAVRPCQEITVEQVAAEAAIGKGTVYLYFRDKNDLFLQTALSGLNELADVVERASSMTGPFDAKLKEVVQRVGRFWEQRRQMFRLQMSEELHAAWRRAENSPDWATGKARLFDGLRALLQEGVERQRIRADVPADFLAHLLLGMVRGMVRFRRAGDEPARDYGRVADILLDGIRARRDRSRTPDAGRTRAKAAGRPLTEVRPLTREKRT